MNATVVIPVWNGASVVLNCLETLYQNTDDDLLEVICVDNASQDASASLIAEHYPQVHLLREPTNLGFAGGVNVGIQIAKGDLCILLNQDCLVQPGWLTHIVSALNAYPTWGIAGCTLLNSEGDVDHAGAYISYPSLRGVHYQDQNVASPRTVDYVTGALFAIRRQVWEQIGLFDADYFPAYYEETDYCYRARQAGFEIGYVPEAHAVHLRSSDAWRVDPLRHVANQELSRYRFVVKHLTKDQILAFAAHELAVLDGEAYFDPALARVLAVRKTLRSMPVILARREADLPVPPDPERDRLLQTLFQSIAHRAQWTALKLSMIDLVDQPDLFWRDLLQSGCATLPTLTQLEPNALLVPDSLPVLPPVRAPFQELADQLAIYRANQAASSAAAETRIAELRIREHTLMNHLLRTSRPHGLWPQLKWYARRIARFASDKDSVLESELNRVRSMIIDELQQQSVQETRRLSEFMTSLITLLEQREADEVTRRQEVHNALLSLRSASQHASDYYVRVQKQIHRRLQLLELLTDYDYR